MKSYAQRHQEDQAALQQPWDQAQATPTLPSTPAQAKARIPAPTVDRIRAPTAPRPLALPLAVVSMAPTVLALQQELP